MVKVHNFYNQTLILAVYLQNLNNFKLSLEKLKINQEAIIICLIQSFEADFPKKVSLKILNSVITLKTSNHVCVYAMLLLP